MQVHILGYFTNLIFCWMLVVAHCHSRPHAPTHIYTTEKQNEKHQPVALVSVSKEEIKWYCRASCPWPSIQQHCIWSCIPQLDVTRLPWLRWQNILKMQFQLVATSIGITVIKCYQRCPKASLLLCCKSLNPSFVIR